MSLPRLSTLTDSEKEFHDALKQHNLVLEYFGTREKAWEEYFVYKRIGDLNNLIGQLQVRLPTSNRIIFDSSSPGEIKRVQITFPVTAVYTFGKDDLAIVSETHNEVCVNVLETKVVSEAIEKFISVFEKWTN